MKTLVIGDVMLDIYVRGSISRISPEAPVPVVLFNSSNQFVGGAGNMAVNLAAAGSEVTLASLIGNDDNGKKLVSLLKEKNIEVLNLSDKYHTIVKERITDNDGVQVVRVDYEDKIDFSLEEQVNLAKKIIPTLDKFDYVVFSDYNKGLLKGAFVQAIIQQINFKHPNIKVFVDAKKDPFIFMNSFLIKPNINELRNWSKKDLCNDEEIFDTIHKLEKELHVKNIVCTLGARGAAFIDKGNHIIPSEVQEVHDVSGAGDTFLAYLVFGYDRYKNLTDAIKFANKAAGIAVSRRGTSIISIYEVDGVSNVSLEQKRLGKKVVFTNGCFDILHAGHIKSLEEAKKQGDILVVGLNSDASIKRLKGNDRPVNKLEDRKKVLESLNCVDYVIPFEEDTPLNLIKLVKPDVLVKGGDYKEDEIVGSDFVKSYGGKVVIIPLVEGLSTTNIIKKCGKK